MAFHPLAQLVSSGTETELRVHLPGAVTSGALIIGDMFSAAYPLNRPNDLTNDVSGMLSSMRINTYGSSDSR